VILWSHGGMTRRRRHLDGLNTAGVFGGFYNWLLVTLVVPIVFRGRFFFFLRWTIYTLIFVVFNGRFYLPRATLIWGRFICKLWTMVILGDSLHSGSVVRWVLVGRFYFSVDSCTAFLFSFISMLNYCIALSHALLTAPPVDGLPPAHYSCSQ